MRIILRAAFLRHESANKEQMMNSIENPELSYLCDLTAEHDKLIQINAELVAALERACAALDMTVNSGDMVAAVTDCDDALLTARAALVKAKQGE